MATASTGLTGIHKAVTTTRGYLGAALVISALAGGGVGSTVTLVSAPDLELAKRDAVDEAVERMRAELDRELGGVESRLERIETDLSSRLTRLEVKLDRLIERGSD